MLTNNQKSVLDYLISLSSDNDSCYIKREECIAAISSSELTLILDSLTDAGYIKSYKDISGGRRVSLTHQGISYKELESTSNENASSIINNFNAPISNSAFSNTGTAIVNNGLSFSELRSIIASKDISESDKEDAIKVVDYVEALTENDAPLKKGFLNKFSDVIHKHSWLPTLIGTALIKYFIG